MVLTSWLHILEGPRRKVERAHLDRDAEVAALAASTATLADKPREAIRPCRTMTLYVLISFSCCTGRELTVADCSTVQMMDEEDDVSSHSDHSARTPFSSIQTG